MLRKVIRTGMVCYTSKLLLPQQSWHFRCLAAIVRPLSSDIRFSEKHEWFRPESGDPLVGKVGVSRYAQEALGDVVYVQMPDVGAEFNQDDECGAVESVKAANEIYTPISGRVVEVNKALDEKPGLINTSCYDEGWIFKIQIRDPKEVEGLMDEKAYEEFLKTVQS